jgi:hypothetical protein
MVMSVYTDLTQRNTASNNKSSVGMRQSWLDIKLLNVDLPWK